MGNSRDEIRKILESNLVIEFKNHDALSTLDTYNATIKLIQSKLDNVIDLIIDVFEKTSN